MIIEVDKVVALAYELEVDGLIEDKATKEQPLEFIFGQGYLLPNFEENVAGKQVGDIFDFTLTPEEGYGTYNPEAVVDLPKSIFSVDGKIKEDLLIVENIIPIQTQDGRVLPGRVVSVTEDQVKMDFNHKLAGKSLHFTGEVARIREATEKELEEGLFGERASHGCSGDCSRCGGGCH